MKTRFKASLFGLLVLTALISFSSYQEKAFVVMDQTITIDNDFHFLKAVDSVTAKEFDEAEFVLIPEDKAKVDTVFIDTRRSWPDPFTLSLNKNYKPNIELPLQINRKIPGDNC